MQLHAVTGSHQEEAAVNSNSLWTVMELTVFVGLGGEGRVSEWGWAGRGGGTKVIRSQRAARHLSAPASFLDSFRDTRAALFQLVTGFAQKAAEVWEAR